MPMPMPTHLAQVHLFIFRNKQLRFTISTNTNKCRFLDPIRFNPELKLAHCLQSRNLNPIFYNKANQLLAVRFRHKTNSYFTQTQFFTSPVLSLGTLSELI